MTINNRDREVWKAAIRCAADQADRVDIEVGGESYRQAMLKNYPSGRGAMAHRILRLLDYDPPEPREPPA